MEKVIGTIITCLVSAGMGYVLNGLKTYKHHAKKLLEEFAQLKQDQLDDMRAALANKFYTYNTMEEVDDYLYVSFVEGCNKYFSRGGDRYIHDLYERSKKWKIKKTGVRI